MLKTTRCLHVKLKFTQIKTLTKKSLHNKSSKSHQARTETHMNTEAFLKGCELLVCVSFGCACLLSMRKLLSPWALVHADCFPVANALWVLVFVGFCHLTICLWALVLWDFVQLISSVYTFLWNTNYNKDHEKTHIHSKTNKSDITHDCYLSVAFIYLLRLHKSP